MLCPKITPTMLPDKLYSMLEKAFQESTEGHFNSFINTFRLANK